MIKTSAWLLPAYAANILILAPVCWSLFNGSGMLSVFEGKVENSDGLRLLVASLYMAILLASIIGLILPAFFAPLILIQIIYKSIWLIAFILPLSMAGNNYPVGISVTFLMIVLTYPILLWLAIR